MAVTLLSLRGFHDKVNITALGLPAGVTLVFTPSSLGPGQSAAARVEVSNFAAIGNYTVIILGVSGSVSHRVTLQLNIFPGPIEAVYLLVTIAAVASVASFFVIRRRGERRRRDSALEDLLRQASTDMGYVATARAIARLEELRATNKVDEDTYERLRREYEKRLEKSK